MHATLQLPNYQCLVRTNCSRGINDSFFVPITLFFSSSTPTDMRTPATYYPSFSTLHNLSPTRTHHHFLLFFSTNPLWPPIRGGGGQSCLVYHKAPSWGSRREMDELESEYGENDVCPITSQVVTSSVTAGSEQGQHRISLRSQWCARNRSAASTDTFVAHFDCASK